MHVRHAQREAMKNQDLIKESFVCLVDEGRQILDQAGWDGNEMQKFI